MEKYNDAPRRDHDYNLYTAEYITALFTMFHPLQSYRYPSTNNSTSYVPSWKVYKPHLARLRARNDNDLRYLLNFRQVYAQNFSPYMLEVLRDLPGRRSHRSHNMERAEHHKIYMELNQRRPSVIRRSICNNSQCSSPREAVLQPNFDEVDHEIDQENTQTIHEDQSAFIKIYPHLDHRVSPITPRKRPTEHKRHIECKTSPTPQKQRRKSSESIDNLIDMETLDPEGANVDKVEAGNTTESSNVPRSHVITSKDTTVSEKNPTKSQTLKQNEKTYFDLKNSKAKAPKKSSSRNLIESENTKFMANPKSNYVNSMQSENSKKDKKFKFCCFLCKKRFRWFSHWQAHERTHTGERPYKCTECDRCFTRGDGLQAHMTIHTTEKTHKCTICSKLFSRKAMLDRHVVEHTGVIPYKCDSCNVEIQDVEHVEEHLAKHEGQTKYKCQYCSKVFYTNVRKLVRHIRGHTGEKPFPCSQCKMRFGKKSALVIHHRVHSGAKPFRCPNCGKTFSISGNLRRHLLIHTGERPYECSTCKKTFNNKSHLARHITSQHK